MIFRSSLSKQLVDAGSLAIGNLDPAGGILGLGHPFWQPEWDEVMHSEVILCSIVLGLAGVLCSAAGIGGGGIYVSALMVLGALSPRDAVPLSKAVVFFGATINLYTNVKRVFASVNNPNEPSLINFDACRLVVPTALMGTLLGVLLNPITPDWIIVTVLTLTLVFMTIVVTQKGYKQYQEEDKEMNSNAGGGHAIVGPDSGPADESGTGAQASTNLNQHSGQLASMRDIVSSGCLLLVVIVFGIVRYLTTECRMEKLGEFPQVFGRGCTDPILTLVFGSKMDEWMSSGRAAIACQSVMVGIPVFACGVLSFFAVRQATATGWPMQRIVAFQSMGLVTGCLAGLVGIGGGLIFSPFFLMVGMSPEIAVATSATCIIFTSSSTTMQYMFTYRIIMSLALVYGAVNFGASYIGMNLVLELKKMDRPSYITFIIATGVGISALLTVQKFVQMMRDPNVSMMQVDIYRTPG